VTDASLKILQDPLMSLVCVLSIPRRRPAPSRGTCIVCICPPHNNSFLQIRGARELEANALEEAALGSDTDSFVFPVISKNRPAVPFIWL